jgi:serine/threonine protein kinase
MALVSRGAQELISTLAHEETLPGAMPASWSLNPASPDVARATLPAVDGSGAILPSKTPDQPRFVERESLGRGGVGEVVLAEDRDMLRTVAIKRLRADMRTPQLVARFVAEVQTLGSLDHPNIIPVHDVGVDTQGQHYFTMKHVRGQTLEQLIAALDGGDPAVHARFPMAARLQVFLGVMSAVHAAHTRGVLHRDIKPANVMVGMWDEPLLMDWGLAVRKEDLKRYPPPAGVLSGTPRYMSPEQARGDGAAVDERTDVYALGVLLHEWLTLRHYIPNSTSTLEGTLAAVLATPPPTALATVHPHQDPLPLDLGYFIEKAMAKDPQARFQSVADMMTELTAIMQGRCRVQCQVTLVKRGTHEFTRWMDRNPRGAILLTSGLATVLLTNVVFLLQRLF